MAPRPSQRARRWPRTLLAVVGATMLGAATAGPVPDGGWRVAREAGEWVIEADAAPRDALARRLAELGGSTGAQLAGVDVLARARPLTLRWRGRDLAAAWAAVLGGEASHAVQCQPAGCRVWVLGLLPSSRSPSSLSSPPSSPSPVATVRDGRASAPAARRAPDALPTRDPGTADPPLAEPPAEPLAPDPPGLFSGE